MAKVSEKVALREKRKARIRKRLSGTSERPRLSIFRSSRHVYAQVVDDVTSKTLVSVSSFSEKASRCGVEGCEALGRLLAKKCKEGNINTVLFDKNGYCYHGRVKAFADGARSGGLVF